MVREKMSRANRAKQFAPFDALKGLHDALRLKEYEHEKSQKGDLTEEQIEQISGVLLSLKKNDIIEVTYFDDGYEKTLLGQVKVNFDMQSLSVDDAVTISFENIIHLKRL